MEASPQPPPPPPQAPPPAPPATGGAPTWPAILVTVLFGLVALFFAAVSISLAGDTICEEAIEEAQQSGQLFVDCVDKSSGNKTATVIAGILAALASVWVMFASIAVARGRKPWGSLGIPIGAAVVLSIITVIL